MRHIAMLPYGPSVAQIPIVLMDSDRDGLGELAFEGDAHPGRVFAIAEYRPVNQYELVQADTSEGLSPPCSLALGWFSPYAAADLDRDGRMELAGEVTFFDTVSGVLGLFVCSVESPAPDTFPRVFNWFRVDSGRAYSPDWRCIADLDQDSCLEVLTCWAEGDSYCTAVFENIGNDERRLVHCRPPADPKVFCDFDQNGRMDLVCRCSYPNLAIVECAGDDQYVQVCSLPYPGPWNDLQCDYFTGRDVDRNGRPEFFVAYHRLSGSRLFLYQIEAEAEHEYVWYPLGSVVGSEYNLSTCAGLDGDSIEEAIWACNQWVRILKATGPHQFDTACVWQNVLSFFSLCNAADYNRNGYNELYIGGNAQMEVVEVEAIRVAYPTGRGLEFVAGDTCWVRWDTLTPPRCDSVSLFLLSDTVVPEDEWFYQLDTIVTGLAPGDTTYPWAVPDTTLTAAWIVAIAYGPGWQFDRSDEPFSIRPAGVAEDKGEGGGMKVGPATPTVVGDVLWLGRIGDSPGRARYSPHSPQSATLFSVSGRKVMALSPGQNDIRHLAPGVYFVRPAGTVPAGQGTVPVRAKVVIQR